MNKRLDREVREYMRGWACAGLPIKHELLKAVGYMSSGELSEETAGKLELVIAHTRYNGYEVLVSNAQSWRTDPETDDQSDLSHFRPPLERSPYPTVKVSYQFDAIPESKAASNWMTAA